VYATQANYWWSQNYAMLPTIDIMDDILRVYFASLDEEKIGRIGFIDLDAHNPKNIVNISEEPVLDIGELGLFDDSGVNPSCLINIFDCKYLYYIGWQRTKQTPYMLFTGLAVSKNGSPFKKVKNIPILDRTNDEPYSRSAPFVMKEGNIFKMWYWSCIKWSAKVSNEPHYNNVIKYAVSNNGIDWIPQSEICISPNFVEEYSVGRPWVVKDDNLYKMWYSIRSHSEPYKIGYAISENGVHWERQDENAGISRSQSGWDSEMICYPCIIDVHGQRYLFYNGNRHGSTGFGYAVWES